MANGITKVEAENQSLRTRLRNSQRSNQERAKAFQSLAVKGVAAYAIDGFGLRDTFSILDFDGLTVMAAVGVIGGEYVDGDAGQMLRDVGEAALIVKAFEMGRDAGAADRDETAAREETPRTGP